MTMEEFSWNVQLNPNHEVKSTRHGSDTLDQTYVGQTILCGDTTSYFEDKHPPGPNKTRQVKFCLNNTIGIGNHEIDGQLDQSVFDAPNVNSKDLKLSFAMQHIAVLKLLSESEHQKLKPSLLYVYHDSELQGKKNEDDADAKCESLSLIDCENVILRIDFIRESSVVLKSKKTFKFNNGTITAAAAVYDSLVFIDNMLQLFIYDADFSLVFTRKLQDECEFADIEGLIVEHIVVRHKVDAFDLILIFSERIIFSYLNLSFRNIFEAEQAQVLEYSEYFVSASCVQLLMQSEIAICAPNSHEIMIWHNENSLWEICDTIWIPEDASIIKILQDFDNSHFFVLTQSKNMYILDSFTHCTLKKLEGISDMHIPQTVSTHWFISLICENNQVTLSNPFTDTLYYHFQFPRTLSFMISAQTGICDDQMCVHKICEISIVSRIMQLIDKQKFRQAERMATMNDIDMQMVYVAKANKLKSELCLSLSQDVLQQLLNCLNCIEDPIYIFSFCRFSEIPNISMQVQLISYACQQLEPDSAYRESLLDLLNSLGTYDVLYGAETFDLALWHQFLGADLARELMQFLQDGKWEEAMILWQRHRNEFKSFADKEFFEQLFVSMPHTLSSKQVWFI